MSGDGWGGDLFQAKMVTEEESVSDVSSKIDGLKISEER